MTEEHGMEEDPRAIQEREIEDYEQDISRLHDLAEQVKETGETLSEKLLERANEVDDQEMSQEYQRLANAARLAYRRVEHGDNTIVRGGL